MVNKAKEEFLKNEKNISEILEKIDFDDFDKVKDRIVYKLCNERKNRIVLKESPYTQFMDLAIVYLIAVHSEEYDVINAVVTDKMMDVWGITKENLHWIACENTMRMYGVRIEPMSRYVAEILDENADMSIPFWRRMADCGDGTLEMELEKIREGTSFEGYIISNNMGINGAVGIVYPGLMKNIAQRMNSDFYMLPSSVHELIVFPAEDDSNGASLRKMVKEVNSTQLVPREILSDNVYYYNKEMDKMYICS